MNNKNFDEQIKKLFEQTTLPVHVPNIDILLTHDEIIYSAKKLIPQDEFVPNENWDYDSVSKPQFIRPHLKYQIIHFVIREGKIFIISAKHE